MEEKNKSRLGAYAGYFISGAAIGTVLGVLFAPKSGRDTRDEMNAWIEKTSKKGRAGIKAMQEALESRRRSFRAKHKELSRG